MALKITTQIGTDKGITSEAYVRITDYQISKFGLANFRLEIFQNEEDSKSIRNTTLDVNRFAKNQQIGDFLNIQLTREESETRITKINTMNSEGNWVEVENEVIETNIVPDLSSAQGIDIFTFGYTHLKDKLIDLFGEGNVVDC